MRFLCEREDLIDACSFWVLPLTTAVVECGMSPRRCSASSSESTSTEECKMDVDGILGTVILINRGVVVVGTKPATSVVVVKKESDTHANDFWRL